MSQNDYLKATGVFVYVQPVFCGYYIRIWWLSKNPGLGNAENWKYNSENDCWYQIFRTMGESYQSWNLLKLIVFSFLLKFISFLPFYYSPTKSVW